MKHVTASAENIAAGLFSAEDHLDAALASHFASLQELSAGRRRAGLSIQHTQPVLERGTEVIKHLVESRRTIGRYHDGLQTTARMAGVDITMVGPLPKPDSETLPIGGGVMREDENRVA